MHLLNAPAKENCGSDWVLFSFGFYVIAAWQLVILENKQDDNCLAAEGRKNSSVLPYSHSRRPIHIILVTHHNWKLRQQLLFTQHKDIQITSIK